MLKHRLVVLGSVVALLAEGVDRNLVHVLTGWRYYDVALLAEGVDRNSKLYLTKRGQACRPPRGGRG